MSREIRFRSKQKISGEWVFGYYFVDLVGNHWILSKYKGKGKITHPPTTLQLNRTVEHRVLSETVGQYTGLKDKNGVEIYEGDIVVHYNPVLDECFEDRMKYKTEATMFNLQIMDPERRIRMEIIGNIHDDNPDLLKKSLDK